MLHYTDATYVLKTDDDIFIHMSALMNYLKTRPYLGVKYFILCAPAASSKVNRSWRSKWHVSPKEFPARVYPTYCPGWSVMYSVDTVNLLYEAAQEEPFFWIDDVYVTGILAKKVNVTPTPMKDTLISARALKFIIDRTHYVKQIMIGPPNLPVNMIRNLHNIVTDKPN